MINSIIIYYGINTNKNITIVFELEFLFLLNKLWGEIYSSGE